MSSTLDRFSAALDQIGLAPEEARSSQADWSSHPEVRAFQEMFDRLHGEHLTATWAEAAWSENQVVKKASVALVPVHAESASPLNKAARRSVLLQTMWVVGVVISMGVGGILWANRSPQATTATDDPSPSHLSSYTPFVLEWAGPPQLPMLRT